MTNNMTKIREKNENGTGDHAILSYIQKNNCDSHFGMIYDSSKLTSNNVLFFIIHNN